MKESLLKLFATDKELYDIMVSAQQRLTKNNMLEIGKGRRTFFSIHEDRDDIIEYMSLLIYDYEGVLDILERRESSRRSEKNTSVTIPIELTASEIKDFVSSFNDKNKGVENMTLHGGAKTATINLEYTDYDFSKTRLAQKTARNASLVLEVGEGKTVIRLPSTEKSRSIVSILHSRLESMKKKELPLEEVSLSLLITADERSTFFTKLISRMDKFALEGVTSLKVAAWPSNLGALSDDNDDEDFGEAAAEMMAVVKSVAISGENLVASAQYQRLRKDGFYITLIRWRARELSDPFELAEFEATFDDAAAGTGFKYLVRTAKQTSKGTYSKQLKLPTDIRQRYLYSLIESTARSAINELLNNSIEVEDKSLKSSSETSQNKSA